jgi:hypothetical protein
MCHRTCFNNYTYGSGQGGGSTPGKEAHAAAVVECMDCHAVRETGQYDHAHWPEYMPDPDACYKCHIDNSYYGDGDFIVAGGFNLTNRTWDTGERAAHMDFVLDSINDSLMEGANEACIACHTRIGVNITWRKSTTLHFDASETHNGTWLIDVFTVHGYNYTNSTYPNNWTNSY